VAIDIADIVVSDVDGGVNSLSLAGAHAAYFQINGSTLQLKPGVVLDTESVAQLDVLVNVDDASVGVGIDDAIAYSVFIDNIDEPPVLSNLETSPLNFVENNAAVLISSDITIADPDSALIQSATVKIVGAVTADDALLFTNQGAISGQYDGLTGKLALSGLASVADYQNALRSVQFVHTGENPDASPRSIEFVVNDGTSESNAITRQLNIVPINDAPTITVTPLQTNLPENTDVSVATDVANINVNDVDSGANTLSLTGAHASLFQITGNKLQLKPGITLDTETVPQLDVDVNVDDASVGLPVDDSAQYSLIVGNVNESPMLSAVEASALTFVENDAAMPVTSSVTVSDVDSGIIESASVRIVDVVSANDSLSFTDQNGISGLYDSASGVLTLTGTASIADYQTALQSVMFTNNNDAPTVAQREVEFQVSDGITQSNTLSRMVDVVPATYQRYARCCGFR